jgi:hypothetical protein
MKRYKDRSGKSGVFLYEIGKDYILVRFTGSDAVYKYSYKRPGKKHVEMMKKLAEKGEGLSTYISQFVREEYEGNS